MNPQGKLLPQEDYRLALGLRHTCNDFGWHLGAVVCRQECFGRKLS